MQAEANASIAAAVPVLRSVVAIVPPLPFEALTLSEPSWLAVTVSPPDRSARCNMSKPPPLHDAGDHP